MNPIDRYDFGIVFRGTTDTPGTYVDINGQTQREAQLQNGVEVYMAQSIASAYFHIGGVGRATFQVDIDGGGQNFDVALHGHNDLDPAQPFGAIASFRNDTQSNLAVHNFAASGRYMLQTPDFSSVPEGAVSVTSHGAGDAARVTVRLRVER